MVSQRVVSGSSQSCEAHGVKSRIFESGQSRLVEVLTWQACMLVMWRMAWIRANVAKLMWLLMWHV